MIPFCNNLHLGDPVLDVTRNRPGRVSSQPRESSINVQVVFQGSNTGIYVPIGNLRLIVDGKAEDVAPHDGEIPAEIARASRAARAAAPGAGIDACEVLREKKKNLKAKMDAMTADFTAMRAECDKIDQALAVLA